tara:strand:- start:12673 stop:13038 length:366 start_codon:yes stop_codon:yes gene_type:complete
MKETKRRYGKYLIASSSSPDDNTERRPVENRDNGTRTSSSLPSPGKPNMTAAAVMNALRDKPYCEKCGGALRFCNKSRDMGTPLEHLWRCKPCKLAYHPEYLHALYGFKDEVSLMSELKKN